MLEGGLPSERYAQETPVPDSNTPPGCARDRLTDKRRSRRVQIAMPVAVRGKSESEIFEEKTVTAAVSAHGCMVHLSTPVERGEQVAVVNTAARDEQICTVSYLGQADDGRTEVGLQFMTPCPRFWRMHFPPDDWDPADRKLPSGSLPVAGRR